MALNSVIVFSAECLLLFRNFIIWAVVSLPPGIEIRKLKADTLSICAVDNTVLTTMGTSSSVM
jgi:hypothetical protein